ncbi:MAG: RIO1 family regulatory kinase/ATPase [Candidatus Nezhaarchaeales archaeon]
MSEAAKVLRNLKAVDFRVLRAIERGMRTYEYVPVERLQSLTKLQPEALARHLSFLNKLGLIRTRRLEYVGYTLKTVGYDALALYTLTNKGVIEALGPKLGIGKEADIYEALTPAEERVAVKFHRLGRLSFRQTRRLRSYIGDRGRPSWLYESTIAAKREFQALHLLRSKNAPVPRPIIHNRHVVVMSLIEGDPLYVCDVLPDPVKLLKEILEGIRIAYSNAGIVHADLSEYNIVVTPDIHPLIIDWPQWVPAGHPEAKNYLKRDVKNILTYFKKRLKVDLSLNEALKTITASSTS